MAPYKTVVIFVFLSLIGLAVVSRFSIDLQPNYSLPTLTISFTLPDASPETVEQEATAPLENVLSQITNIKK
ncbi:MAG: efflux RND transporter permease subunit, partial [Cytophagales bacterium]|nr:efflux RND transporter permease subunit [Cytophagales bacterium]